MKNKPNARSKRPSAKLVLSMAMVAMAGAAANASAEIYVKDKTNAVLNTKNTIENGVSAVANTATAIKMHYVIDELKRIGGEGGETLYNIQKNYNQQQTEYNNYIKNITEINNNYYEGGAPIIVDPIEGLKLDAGDYTAKYHDAGHYQGMTAGQLAGISNDFDGSESQKKANVALLNNLAGQQERLKNDAGRLQALQSDSVAVVGHAKQMQYANMLAAEQSNQLMQLRALTLAEQNAEAARAQIAADRQARELAAARILRSDLPEVSNVNDLGVTNW